MNSKQLRCCIAVAKENSIIKAANHLPLTPSAIAKTIISLEKELGFLIFERLPRGVKLTPAGEIWIPHAEKILYELNQVRSNISKNLAIQRLDIGIPNNNLDGFDILEKSLSDFSNAHPYVDVVLHNILLKKDQLDALRSGKISIAFNTLFPKFSDLYIEEVARENICIVAGMDNPISHKSHAHLREINNMPIIVFPEARKNNEHFKNTLENEGFSPAVGYASSDLFAHLGLSACNKGISLLSPVVKNLNFPGVKFIEILSDHPLTVPYEFIKLKKASSPVLDSFLNTVRKYKRI